MTAYERAVQFENAGEYEKAFELFKQCLSQDGYDNGEIFFHCGWCLENSKSCVGNQAVRFYEQASAEAASVLTRVNSAFRAGWILLHDKDSGKAATVFKRAIDLAEEAHLNHELYHQALFWYALCLEHLGRYLEAVHRYEAVQGLSASLASESSYRQIICYNQVGRYEAALSVCRSFPDQAPEGFDPHRHAELHVLVKKEEGLLLRCLSE